MAAHRATATPAVDGVLLVDKPPGVTSHDVVAVVRRVAGVRRVGHAGTLDPFATGLLVLLIGRGTRLLPYIDGEPKVYDATIRFGVETETDDATGATTRRAPPPSPADVRSAIDALTGEIDQMPPAYSAKRVDGVRAYAAARRGRALVLESTRVLVHSWEVLGLNTDTLDARIVCSGGTYIRALARDLGRLASSAAHVSSLRRLQSGVFHVRDAVSLERVRAGDVKPLSLRTALTMPSQSLDAIALSRVINGHAIPARVDAPRVALVDEGGDLVGVAERTGADLQPRVVLRDAR